ncbi:hypothetical protein ACLB2K_049264 [Fragaria x ananassa]
MSSTSSILIILLIVVILIICRILRHVSSSPGDDCSARLSSGRVSPAGAADCAVCLSKFEGDDQLRLLASAVLSWLPRVVSGHVAPIAADLPALADSSVGLRADDARRPRDWQRAPAAAAVGGQSCC